MIVPAKVCTKLEQIGHVLCARECTEGNEKVEKKQAEIEKKERDVGKVKANREKAVMESGGRERYEGGGGQEGHGDEEGGASFRRGRSKSPSWRRFL
jgi:hypothetical protein